MVEGIEVTGHKAEGILGAGKGGAEQKKTAKASFLIEEVKEK